MARHARPRKIVEPPRFKGYKPYGAEVVKKEVVEILYEEYEAIKLADYDNLNHKEAADLMGVSRPTFARIYDSARKKIAQALTETRELKTVFGNAYFDKHWYLCSKCHARFTIPAKKNKHECPLCKSENINLIE